MHIILAYFLECHVILGVQLSKLPGKQNLRKTTHHVSAVALCKRCFEEACGNNCLHKIYTIWEKSMWTL